MASESIGAKQEKMIEQVAATMALENMPLSRDCYKSHGVWRKDSRAGYSGDHGKIQKEDARGRIANYSTQILLWESADLAGNQASERTLGLDFRVWGLLWRISG